jgi:hypothetical protein
VPGIACSPTNSPTPSNKAAVFSDSVMRAYRRLGIVGVLTEASIRTDAPAAHRRGLITGAAERDNGGESAN